MLGEELGAHEYAKVDPVRHAVSTHPEMNGPLGNMISSCFLLQRYRQSIKALRADALAGDGHGRNRIGLLNFVGGDHE